MEHIQNALEQFKQSQSRARGPEAIHTKSSPGTAIPEPLVYRQTRTVSISIPDLIARRVIVGTQGGPFVDSYKILRTQILHRLQEHQWNVIGVTSPGRLEGKSLVAANLAISIAMEHNHTAMLIDGNLRHPHVHQLFALPNRGLADYLLDTVSVSDLLVHPDIDRFVVMPAGGPIKNSVEFLTLAKMTAFVKELKHRYASRVVVFDLPPLLDTADVIGIAPKLDAVLLVVEEGRTTENQVRNSLSTLSGTVPLLGTVLNKAGRLSGGVSV